jgi:hypothetical protein
MSLTVLFPAVGQENPERESIPCVTLNRIDDIEILDDRNIVFQMRGNDHYLNILPYTCNGLGPGDTIMFRTSLNEVCEVDVITVADDIGPGLRAGVSCGLGRFHPTTEDEIGKLRDLLRQ